MRLFLDLRFYATIFLMTRLIFRTVFLLTAIILFLLKPSDIKAQGAVYCHIGSVGACEPDYQGGTDPNEFVECSTGYAPPASCNANPQTCCTNQPPTNCQNIACVLLSACIFPQCPSGQECTGLDPGLCGAAGGTSTNCSNASGSCGTCCQDISPSPGSCPNGYSCQQVIGGQASCSANGGIFVGTDGCTTSSGGTGNCCTPIVGIYHCAWNGVNCYTDIAGSTGPYTCQANYGHCSQGDPGCTACEDITLQANCLGENPRTCIQQNPTIGYYCAGATLGGCQPCFAWNADPNDPSYIPECDPPPFADLAECDPSGSGSCNIPVSTVIDRPALNPECTTSNGEPGINTAIGCFPVRNLTDFSGFLLRWGIGIGGGIAFLLILYSGFQITTSAGDPQKLQAGRELLTAAIAGLMILIFSVFLLEIIGVRILRLPGF